MHKSPKIMLRTCIICISSQNFHVMIRSCEGCVEFITSFCVVPTSHPKFGPSHPGRPCRFNLRIGHCTQSRQCDLAGDRAFCCTRVASNFAWEHRGSSEKCPLSCLSKRPFLTDDTNTFVRFRLFLRLSRKSENFRHCCQPLFSLPPHTFSLPSPSWTGLGNVSQFQRHAHQLRDFALPTLHSPPPLHLPCSQQLPAICGIFYHVGDICTDYGNMLVKKLCFVTMIRLLSFFSLDRESE